jgi:hypothetical protein
VDHGQKHQFSFADFYNLTSLQHHSGLNIVTMEEFLLREAMTGNLVHTQTRQVSFSPHNITSWDGTNITGMGALSNWLLQVTTAPNWFHDRCMLVIPAEAGAQASIRLRQS